MDIYSVPRTEEHSAGIQSLYSKLVKKISTQTSASRQTELQGIKDSAEAGEIKLEEYERPFQRRQNLSRALPNEQCFGGDERWRVLPKPRKQSGS